MLFGGVPGCCLAFPRLWLGRLAAGRIVGIQIISLNRLTRTQTQAKIAEHETAVEGYLMVAWPSLGSGLGF